MKNIVSYLILIIFSSVVYALPCPNGKGILYKGDSMAEVIRQCGTPLKEQVNQRIIVDRVQWVYNRYNRYYPGVSQLIINFNQGNVESIMLADSFWYPSCRQIITGFGNLTTIQTTCGNVPYYVNATNLCGPLISIGTSLETVVSICGRPNFTVNLERYTIEETELIYTGTQRAQSIIFQNGKLTDFR